MGSEFAELCRRTVAYDDNLVRNIKSIRLSQDLYDDLAESPEDTRIAVAAEGRLRVPSGNPFVTRPFDYGTVITYSFDSAHWQESRFSNARQYGAWYGALDVRTSVFETVYHWHRFLMDSFGDVKEDIIGERRVFDVRCDAMLVDLRGCETQTPRLTDRKSYAFTQALGRYLVEQQQNGVLFPSARCDGINVAVFTAARLSSVHDKTYLTYRYGPKSGRVKVERVPGRAWLTIAPAELY
ncbi:MAG TPA: RES family NAD+ phosphorylase [Steroidobacteraceae bacterium]|nr:RES family NAD+ phosphorylase [Steroidobacteraceae bacterium]